MNSSINIFSPKNTIGIRKLSENNMDRFQTDISINGKTKYQDKDNLINSLQEEISTMKYKMSFYFEKEKEIQDLTKKIKDLENEINKVNRYKLLIVKLKKDNDNIKIHYKKILLELNEYDNIQRENNILKEKIKELTSSESKNNSLDIIIEEMVQNIKDEEDDDIIEDIGNTEDL